MKFSFISKGTYRRATGTQVESDRDQNPVKICVSTDSCVCACVRACMRAWNERDTTPRSQDSRFL